MATAYKTEYPTLATLHMGNRGIDCYDHSDLLGAADKKGDPDWPLPGIDGVEALELFEGGMRVLLLVELDGSFDQDNNLVVGVDARRTQAHAHLDAVRTVAKVGTTQTLTLVRNGMADVTADAIVMSGFRPRHETYDIIKLSLDLLLPGGSLL